MDPAHTEENSNNGHSRLVLLQPTRFRISLASGLAVLCSAGIGSCAKPNEGNMLPILGWVGPHDVRELVGDWNDVTAAVDAGLSAAEVSILPITTGLSVADSTDLGPNCRVFRFESIINTTGTMAIARQPGSGPESAQIVLRASFEGEDGPARTTRLLDGVARRFSQLRGVDSAPLD